MKEYIERAAILKSLGYDEKRRADVLPGSTFDIVLKEAAADVAEVVRCRECKYKDECIRRIEFIGRNPVLEQNTYEYHPLEFCSYGQRKEDDHDKHPSDPV